MPNLLSLQTLMKMRWLYILWFAIFLPFSKSIRRLTFVFRRRFIHCAVALACVLVALPACNAAYALHARVLSLSACRPCPHSTHVLTVRVRVPRGEATLPVSARNAVSTFPSRTLSGAISASMLVFSAVKRAISASSLLFACVTTAESRRNIANNCARCSSDIVSRFGRMSVLLVDVLTVLIFCSLVFVVVISFLRLLTCSGIAATLYHVEKSSRERFPDRRMTNHFQTQDSKLLENFFSRHDATHDI